MKKISKLLTVCLTLFVFATAVFGFNESMVYASDMSDKCGSNFDEYEGVSETESVETEQGCEDMPVEYVFETESVETEQGCEDMPVEYVSETESVETKPVYENLPVEYVSEIESNDSSYSGVCGGNLEWFFDTKYGVLTISGQGRMNDYSASLESKKTVHHGGILQTE